MLTNAPFFVTHNNRETRYWRTRQDKLPSHCEEIENVPHADASDKEIEELINRLKTFKEDEFADLLHSCHNVIRNREHLDPAAAFDEIAKVLFVKVWVEREMKAKRRRVNLFTADYLDEQLGQHPLNDLFQRTKEAFANDRIFASDDRINVKPATGREIVRLLERYNLSDTSEDLKGIAFERFLGKTFGAKSASSSRRAASSNSWSAWWNPKKATSCTTRPAVRAASLFGSSSWSVNKSWPTWTGSISNTQPNWTRRSCPTPSGPNCCATSTPNCKRPLTTASAIAGCGSWPTAGFTVATPTTAWPAPAR